MGHPPAPARGAAGPAFQTASGGRAWPPAFLHALRGRVSGLCCVSETSEGGLGHREVDGAVAQSGPQALGRGGIGPRLGRSAGWLFVDPTPRPPPSAFGAVAVPSAWMLPGSSWTRPTAPGWQAEAPAGVDVRPAP